jgi:hypothetical protein
VQYLACHDDDYQVKAATRMKDKIVPSRTKRDVGRDSCLITGIALKKGDDYDKFSTIGGKKAIGYSSSGTSYGEFHIVDRGNHYLVMSRAEVDAEKYADHGTPGFLIKNRSDYPVTVSLDQIGCLYHDVIKPGATWKKTTGAVWFTISANTSMDGVDHINELKDCVYPVIQAVKFAAELVGTADGCAECGQLAMNDAEMFSATLAGTALYDAITNNTTAKKLAGQYAGPPYPFRCAHMPKYDIVGGPAKQMDVTLGAEEILAIKTEACSIKPIKPRFYPPINTYTTEVPNLSPYLSLKFMEQLADEYNAEVNSKNHKPSQYHLSRITKITLFEEPSKNKKIARELANCKAKGNKNTKHACLAIEVDSRSYSAAQNQPTKETFGEPVFDFPKFYTSQSALCSAEQATYLAQTPPICKANAGDKKITQAECNKKALPELSDLLFPACSLLKGVELVINDKIDKENAPIVQENYKREKALEACEVTPKLKQAWFSKNMQENGIYSEMKGTPLEIKRNGGGCT